MVFRSGRDFAAWIGLVPRQDSTGGKQKLGPISKQGDRYLIISTFPAIGAETV
jgi:transposase